MASEEAPAATAASPPAEAPTQTTAPSSTIPETMKRLVLKEPGKTLAEAKIEVETVPVPKLQPNEILVQMVATAINPSDYGKWTRTPPEKCPKVLGTEGSGIVVAQGGGLVSKRFKLGSKVSLVVKPEGNQGTYSEYVAIPATDFIVALPENFNTEDGASFFVNPLTALGLIETAKSNGSKALVHTAAASQLGQMLNKVAKQEGVAIINVVRREEQAKLLKDLGAEHVVVTAEAEWKETLRNKIDTLKASVAFDAVAGEGAGELLSMLPNKGTLFVYGTLGGDISGINPIDLIYRQKQVKGFFLSDWLSYGGNTIMSVPRIVWAAKKVSAGLQGGWSSSQFKDTTLEKAKDDTVQLKDSTSTGQKLRIRFDVV